MWNILAGWKFMVHGNNVPLSLCAVRSLFLILQQLHVALEILCHKIQKRKVEKFNITIHIIITSQVHFSDSVQSNNAS